MAQKFDHFPHRSLIFCLLQIQSFLNKFTPNSNIMTNKIFPSFTLTYFNILTSSDSQILEMICDENESQVYIK